MAASLDEAMRRLDGALGLLEAAVNDVGRRVERAVGTIRDVLGRAEGNGAG